LGKSRKTNALQPRPGNLGGLLFFRAGRFKCPPALFRHPPRSATQRRFPRAHACVLYLYI
jgi:hypothetical protein